uniref:Uncharacterized protein n=1 Tax=Rhizophora mucronata TaxID=61149 RepID=A0A2P2IMZ0_RHIMU
MLETLPCFGRNQFTMFCKTFGSKITLKLTFWSFETFHFSC